MEKETPATSENAKQSTPEAMALLVEKWLGNPFFRRILRFCTARCPSCGRRIDIVLQRYAGGKARMCAKCSIAYAFVSAFLDRSAGMAGMKKSFVIESLSDYMFRKGLSSVLEGLSEFGPAKPFTSYSPFLIVWNVTNRCNLRCRHCYQNAGNTSPDELDTAKALEAVDRLAENGVVYIALSGGEPLIRKDIFEIAQRMKERDIAFSIATNGTLLSSQNIRKLKELNCRYVQVSLDGADARTHNWFRGRNMFQQTVKGIKGAVKAGLVVGISMTVTKHNYHQHKDMVKLAEKLGVDILIHYNFIPTGRGKGIVDLDITPEQREEILKYFARHKPRGKLNLLSTAPQFGRVSCEAGGIGSMSHFDVFSSSLDSKIGFLADFIGGCGAGRLYASMDPNGDIFPCVFMRIKLGNIMGTDIARVWRTDPCLLKMRDRKAFKDHCGACKYRDRCGGCRARAYGYFGDVQGPDPGCVLNKKHWDALKKGK